MTERLRTTGPRMKLGRRSHDEVFIARPCTGDQRALVRAVLHDTVVKHRETLKALAAA